MAILLRTLTLKSKLNFGYSNIKYLTVLEYFNLCYEKRLIHYYYALDMISFNDEVLNMLGITEDLRIAKPGKLGYHESKKMVQEVFHKYMEQKTISELRNRTMMIKDSKKAMTIKSHFVHGHGKSELQRKNRTHT